MSDDKTPPDVIADEVAILTKRIATRAWLKQNGRDLPQDAAECFALVERLTSAVQRLYDVKSASGQPCSEAL